MSEDSYEYYLELRNSIKEKYLFNQESLRRILRGHFSSAGYFQRKRSRNTENWKKYLNRMEEYLNNPFTLLDDIHYYLHNEIDGFIPSLTSSLFDQKTGEKKLYFTEGNEMTDQEKMWKNDIRRVYHWFQPKYDEKKGGLLPCSPYHCVMEEAFRVYHQKLNVCLEQIDEINRFSEQMNDDVANQRPEQMNEVNRCPEQTDVANQRPKQNEAAGQFTSKLDETYRNCSEFIRLSEKLLFYSLYAASPDIVRIVWENHATFAPIFSQKLTGFYHWGQASSKYLHYFNAGTKHVTRINDFLQEMKKLSEDQHISR